MCDIGRAKLLERAAHYLNNRIASLEQSRGAAAFALAARCSEVPPPRVECGLCGDPATRECLDCPKVQLYCAICGGRHHAEGGEWEGHTARQIESGVVSAATLSFWGAERQRLRPGGYGPSGSGRSCKGSADSDGEDGGGGTTPYWLMAAFENRLHRLARQYGARIAGVPLPGFQFRPGQWDTIRAVLRGRGIVCEMPCSGGKSLTFMAPPFVKAHVAFDRSADLHGGDDGLLFLNSQKVRSPYYLAILPLWFPSQPTHLSCARYCPVCGMARHALWRASHSIVYSIAPSCVYAGHGNGDKLG